jgi:hypothetical protein
MKTYVEFITSKAAQALRSLDPIEQRLVELLATRWHAGKNVTVLQAMSIAPNLISPSTVHRRLKTLRAKGMLVLVSDDIDTRTKYVRPSPELLTMFKRLDAAMQLAGTKGFPA